MSLQRNQDGLILRVEDNGPGVSEEDRLRIFERFHRSAETSSTTIGSGLGMAIVKAIADAHNVSIDITQSSELGGLAVTLHFR